jgi:hypothetical protein
MEVYGKVIELWLVDFHGFSWIFMDFHGFSWIFRFAPEGKPGQIDLVLMSSLVFIVAYCSHG